MLLGTAANVTAIVLGTLFGLLFGRKLPQRITTLSTQGLGLVTALIGAQMMISTQNVLIVLVSIVTGGVAGELARIEERLDTFGARIEKRFSRQRGTFAKAFVTSSLLYCVGPIAIIGALQDGLSGDYSILLTKSGLDGIASIAFASTLGIGVIFSALPVLAYQGSITIAASFLEPYLTSPIVNAMTATGGLLILAIALNILRVTKIRVGNMLPAILVAAILAGLLHNIGVP
jgi:uncharacterized membrane protein YqgA involved in biofilm formation